MSIIHVEKLHFSYKNNELILKDINIKVPAGGIYGFLGANGAGKSTTIRNILGLLQFQSGKISLFGKDLRKTDRSVFKNIGALIESPAFYAHLTAYENLKLACQYRRISKSNIDKVCQKVKLSKHKYKRVKQFSTGMKQRLGLALTLIHDPDLLILDEPTNGLDPKGITEIREILLDLCAEGKTILLSSHLLSEIEKIATHVGIIKEGEIIYEGTLVELNRLKSSSLLTRIRTSSDYLDFKIKHESEIPEIIKKMVSSGVDIYEVQLVKNDLEQLFMNMTNNTSKNLPQV